MREFIIRMNGIGYFCANRASAESLLSKAWPELTLDVDGRRIVNSAFVVVGYIEADDGDCLEECLWL